VKGGNDRADPDQVNRIAKAGGYLTGGGGGAEEFPDQCGWVAAKPVIVTHTWRDTINDLAEHRRDGRVIVRPECVLEPCTEAMEAGAFAGQPGT
jgi:hypothetical protein